MSKPSLSPVIPVRPPSADAPSPPPLASTVPVVPHHHWQESPWGGGLVTWLVDSRTAQIVGKTAKKAGAHVAVILPNLELGLFLTDDAARTAVAEYFNGGSAR